MVCGFPVPPPEKPVHTIPALLYTCVHEPALSSFPQCSNQVTPQSWHLGVGDRMGLSLGCIFLEAHARSASGHPQALADLVHFTPRHRHPSSSPLFCSALKDSSAYSEPARIILDNRLFSGQLISSLNPPSVQ